MSPDDFGRTNNVLSMNKPAHGFMSVEQALDDARAQELTDVLVIGYAQNGDLVIRSSHMSRKDALWLAEQSRLHSLGINV